MCGSLANGAIGISRQLKANNLAGKHCEIVLVNTEKHDMGIFATIKDPQPGKTLFETGSGELYEFEDKHMDCVNIVDPSVEGATTFTNVL